MSYLGTCVQVGSWSTSNGPSTSPRAALPRRQGERSETWAGVSKHRTTSSERHQALVLVNGPNGALLDRTCVQPLCGDRDARAGVVRDAPLEGQLGLEVGLVGV